MNPEQVTSIQVTTGQILSIISFCVSMYSLFLCVVSHREINRMIKYYDNERK